MSLLDVLTPVPRPRQTREVRRTLLLLALMALLVALALLVGDSDGHFDGR